MHEGLVREHRLRNKLQSALILMSMLSLLGVLGWLIAGMPGMLLEMVACAVLVLVGPAPSPGLLLRMYR